jgi:hypothetical protein
MTVVERTSAGLQTVIPGCERRTLPKSTTRVDENGQGLLHFYKPSSLREQLARRADAPLLPRRGQSRYRVVYSSHSGRLLDRLNLNAG